MFGQFIMGPAGSGKSTYCSTMSTHFQMHKRTVKIINLDPAAEEFSYEPFLDIREMISVEDVMEELQYGPNGAFIYCMEYLLENLDFIDTVLHTLDDDAYLLFDLPGQIELYTHYNLITQFVNHLQTTFDLRPIGVYLIESQYMMDVTKYYGGILNAQADMDRMVDRADANIILYRAMIQLGIAWTCIMTKMDLIEGTEVDKEEQEKFIELARKEETNPYYTNTRLAEIEESQKDLDMYLDVSPHLYEAKMSTSKKNTKWGRLNELMAQMIEEWNMVSFHPLNPFVEDSVEAVAQHVDHALQYELDETREMKDIDLNED